MKTSSSPKAAHKADGRAKPILSIQYLRALAVISVVILHRGGITYIIPMTGAGVDLFFVISGYIMFLITARRESSPGVFLWQRLIRIVPPYWCMTTVAILLTLIWPQLLWSVDISPLHVLTSYFFIPHKTVPEFSERLIPALTQGWSLNVEMYFYALIAASLALPRRWQLGALTALFVLLAWINVYHHPQELLADFATKPLLLELLAGLWLGQFWDWKVLPGRKAGFSFIALGFISILVENAFNPLVDDLRPNGGAILIVLGALCIEADGGVKEYTRLRLLGDASYSVYLTHNLVVALIGTILPRGLLSIAVSVAASSLLGVWIYTRLERPLYERLCLIRLPRAFRQ